jgi:protein-disulfide isomerase
MKMAVMIALAATLVVASSTLAQEPVKPVASPAPATPAPGKVLATFGGESITDVQAESSLGPQLVRARQEEYQVFLDGLRDQAFKTLKEREAAKLGISQDELYKKYVTDMVGEPPKEEVDALLKQYRPQLPPDENEARQQVVGFLKGQKTQAREQAWRSELLAAASFKLFLDPPRMAVTPAPADPVWGPADAPVTIIEFSDFQCPYCQRVQPTLKKIRTDYAGKLRMVYKQLPLPMHPQARLAAEASLCANAQGKFWELHEWLFANQGGVTADSLKKAVEELKLEASAFDKCLTEHTFAKQVDADLALDEKLGIQSTPYLLINGRIINGAQPVEAFKEILDDELARYAAAPMSTTK